MLNRRNLRIKAMQTLFAYQQCRKSNKEIAWQELRTAQFGDETFVFNPIFFEDSEDSEDPEEREDPDPVTEPKVVTEERKEQENELRAALEKRLAGEPSTIEKVEMLDQVMSDYQKRLQSDRKHLRAHMLKEVTGVNDLFTWLLALLLALRDHEQQHISKKNQIADGKEHSHYLMGLKPLDILEKRLQGLEVRSWNPHTDRLAQWYKEFKNHQQIDEQLSQSQSSWDQQCKYLRFLFKSVLWKSTSFQDFMEEHDMGWNENQDIIKSLVNKTLKSIDEEGVDLAPLSYQWEEDRQFFEDIFDQTLNLEETSDKLIAEQAQNWDSERIAQLDMVILKMAISEMIKFPSIPVKVTINEYIELSKRYSTPKSKKFINGILDVLAADLTANGTIKKSGRGLIDNK